VRFAPYDVEWEDFRGMNYVAVPRARTDLIERLRFR
jgi:hypothetical protein